VPTEPGLRLLPLGRAPRPIEEFVQFPRVGLPPDPERVPLLDVEQADLVDRRHHAFYRPDGDVPGGEAELFLARRDGRAVGRIAAIVNHQHNRFESTREGFFGFYDAVDDQSVADALLTAASNWLRERGCDAMLGPASPSHNYYYGVRDRADEPPTPTRARILEADNPRYYPRHLEAWGMTCARRLFAYDADVSSEQVARVAARFERTIKQTIAATGLQIRALDQSDFDDEITRANQLLNRSLAENWGFSPLTRPELAAMAKQMRPLIDPSLVLFAELNHVPVGIALALPDYNQVVSAMGGRLGGWPAAVAFANVPLLRRLWPHGHAWAPSRIDTARVIALGVVPTIWREAGAVRREMLRLGPALIFATFEAVRRAGYRWLTASWILEDNKAMQAPFDLVGVAPTRVWKIYRREL
jgi:hypothetical protein